MAKNISFTIGDNSTGILLEIPTSDLANIVPALTADYQNKLPNPAWSGPQSVDANGDPIPPTIDNPMSKKEFARLKIASIINDYVYNYNLSAIKKQKDDELKALSRPNVIASIVEKV